MTASAVARFLLAAAICGAPATAVQADEGMWTFDAFPSARVDRSVIGALFDGNNHSLGGSFGYDPALNRSVVVSTGAVEAALKAVHPAPHLLAELHAD